MKPCLFSVSYAGYWGQAALTLAEFVARAETLGFSSVMLAGKRPHLSPLDATPELLASLAKSGARCEVVAAYTDLAPGRATEVPAIEMQIAYVENLARIAAAVGAKIVRVFTAYESDTLDPQAQWQRVVTALREMCDHAAAHGVTIAIQNHHDL